MRWIKQDELWDTFQTDPDLKRAFQGAKRFAYILERVTNEQTMLNIGIGDGMLERMAAAKGISVYSLDPSERSIAALRDELGLEERAQQGRCTEMPLTDESFDVVVMSEVLEHLEDEELTRTIQEVRRVLKPHGRFIGTVPAAEDIMDNVFL